jgi:hypothetical protein
MPRRRRPRSSVPVVSPLSARDRGVLGVPFALSPGPAGPSRTVGSISLPRRGAVRATGARLCPGGLTTHLYPRSVAPQRVSFAGPAC